MPRSGLGILLLLVPLLAVQFIEAPRVRAQSNPEQNASDITTLEPGKPVEREITGGQTQT